MNFSGRAKSTRNMLTESYPKEVHTLRSETGQESKANAKEQSQDTEYRRAFSIEKKPGEAPRGPAGLSTASAQTSSPITPSHRRRASTKNFVHTDLSSAALKPDWTTSYQRDFRPSASAPGGAKKLSETRSAPPRGLAAESTAAISAESSAVIDANAAAAIPRESTAVVDANAVAAITTEYATVVNADPVAATSITTPASPTGRKSDAERGESMKTVLRHSNFLPNPIPGERRSFDDDDNANPVLKTFINLIARK